MRNNIKEIKRRTKLLIVDDNSNNRDAISYWLNKENYEILHAVNGLSALKTIETFIPDIILLDYNLPDIDGIEVCQKIRLNKDLPFIPIIMMTSMAPEANIMALEQGADEFIVMPIMQTELKSRIKAMLRLKEAISESTVLVQENNKLQELDKIKSNFISKVSHELKTPLQSILGYTDIMLNGLQGELNYPQKLMTKQIQEAGNQLLNLINQILDFETIDKKDSNLIPEIIYIEDMFKYLSQVTSYQCIKKDVKLNLIMEEQNMSFESNRNYVQKILLNIISNSIKFSKNGSKVLVSVKDIEGKSIEFTIHDEGIGISKSNISYIFDKFWQEDDSITRTHGGIGLGLAIAKKLTTLLRGKIIVESKPNNGSMFKVTFPKIFEYNSCIEFNLQKFELGA